MFRGRLLAFEPRSGAVPLNPSPLTVTTRNARHMESHHYEKALVFVVGYNRKPRCSHRRRPHIQNDSPESPPGLGLGTLPQMPPLLWERRAGLIFAQSVTAAAHRRFARLHLVTHLVRQMTPNFIHLDQ